MQNFITTELINECLMWVCGREIQHHHSLIMSKKHNQENRGRGFCFWRTAFRTCMQLLLRTAEKMGWQLREDRKKEMHGEALMIDAAMVHSFVTDRVESSSWLGVESAFCLFCLFLNSLQSYGIQHIQSLWGFNMLMTEFC